MAGVFLVLREGLKKQGLMARAYLQLLSYIRKMEPLRELLSCCLVHSPFRKEADIRLKIAVGLKS